jgi:hypothetical protein
MCKLLFGFKVIHLRSILANIGIYFNNIHCVLNQNMLNPHLFNHEESMVLKKISLQLAHVVVVGS